MNSDAKQSRAMSLVEATTNVVVGFVLALLTQFAIFPWFGLAVTLTDNLIIGAIFTAVSILRSFTLRRLFEALRLRRRNGDPSRVPGRALLTDPAELNAAFFGGSRP